MTYVIKLKRTTKSFDGDEGAVLNNANLAYGEAVFLDKYGYMIVGKSSGTTTVGNATRVFKAIPKSMADNGIYYTNYDSTKKFIDIQLLQYNNSNYTETIQSVYPRTKFEAVTNAAGNLNLATALDNKMDKNNPTGTGYLSLNRKSNTTVGSNSVAVGSNTAATSSDSFAEGSNTTASGTAAHAEGNSTTASGNPSHAEGSQTLASKAYSHSEGYRTIADGVGAHAEGYGYDNVDKQTIASGTGAHAEGRGTLASGDYSHAEGTISLQTSDNKQTVASGIGAHAEGGGTESSGQYSHAEGRRTIASANYSHAEGDATQSTSDCAHAEGLNTVASGTQSHAEGNSTAASGTNSHAQGLGTIAQRKSQHVIGEYNVADSSGSTTTRGTFAAIVGNGTSSSKSNAAAIDWNGNLYLKGNIYVNGSNANATGGGSLGGFASGLMNSYLWRKSKNVYSAEKIDGITSYRVTTGEHGSDQRTFTFGKLSVSSTGLTQTNTTTCTISGRDVSGFTNKKSSLISNGQVYFSLTRGDIDGNFSEYIYKITSNTDAVKDSESTDNRVVTFTNVECYKWTCATSEQTYLNDFNSNTYPSGTSGGYQYNKFGQLFDVLPKMQEFNYTGGGYTYKTLTLNFIPKLIIFSCYKGTGSYSDQYDYISIWIRGAKYAMNFGGSFASHAFNSTSIFAEPVIWDGLSNIIKFGGINDTDYVYYGIAFG